jgi:phage FluMu protein Com
MYISLTEALEVSVYIEMKLRRCKVIVSFHHLGGQSHHEGEEAFGS